MRPPTRSGGRPGVLEIQESSWGKAEGETWAKIDALRQRIEKEEDAKNAKGWRDWVKKNIDEGARNAHLFSKVPLAWCPTEEEDAKGKVTSDPAALLEGQRKKYDTFGRAIAGQGRGFAKVVCATVERGITRV